MDFAVGQADFHITCQNEYVKILQKCQCQMSDVDFRLGKLNVESLVWMEKLVQILKLFTEATQSTKYIGHQFTVAQSPYDKHAM